MCARFWQYPGVNQGYFAPTYPQIRDIFFQTIEEVAHTLSLRVECMEANKEVHFFSGRHYRGTTICRSMERPPSIVGFKIGHALIDEFDVMEPQRADAAWKKIIARLRWKGASNGADVTTTPEGFRTTHKLFVSDLAKNPVLSNEYGIIQASTRDNAKNLPPGYIDTLLDAYPQELRDAYIDGRFCNLSTGTVYNCFNRVKCHSDETVKHGETLHIGMDFNVSKMAATVFVSRESGWHAVHEFHDVFDTPAMVRLIMERFPGHRIIVYPDASGASSHSSDASRSDISILRQSGFEVRVKSSNPRVRDRVLSVNKQFETGRLWVNTRACPVVTKNLEQQAYDAAGEPDKKSGFDHQNDSFGYPIAYEFPIVRPVLSGKVSFGF